MNSTKSLFLTYMSEFNAYCISDENVKQAVAQGKVPFICLPESDYHALGSDFHAEKPLVGYLLGREKEHFSIDYNYAKAVVMSGVNIRFLTYENVLEQMEGINGLIIPGGAFSSPDCFYNDGQKLYEPNIRYQAHELSIRECGKRGLPLLAVCGGAQMVAALHHLPLYRDVHAHSALEHKTKEAAAHKVYIYPDSPLRKILGQETVIVNSRHREAVNPNFCSDLAFYACASDGIPEAWGNEEKNILCVQWHPEDFAAKGDKAMQNIYNWLAEKARLYRLNR